jgi:hypothetical protein
MIINDNNDSSIDIESVYLNSLVSDEYYSLLNRMS